MSVSVRPARFGEARLLTELALRSKAHWGYDAAFLASCREELTLDDAELAGRRTAVAERDGGVVGFTTLEGEPPQGVLGMMFVDPDAIGEGVGRLLFAHAVEAAGTLGFTRFTIDADPNAEPFYAAMGGVPVGTVPSGSIPGRSLTQYLREVPG
ncbi:GNAT family N-acetyltransferase [Streptomyces olivaceus]|uniref:GNAT family N-acetyltransferase n=1 Tax=Streptomyces olivaceus TaxID=47716 RepID=A0ABS7W2H2_STROV|nr:MULTISPECIES: GNAT family N-acetyltransferase [Streptomyces]MBZ6089770.1 GNAT family N-acetyltransferase [Streptomyces olivaceus]MBZ6098281.1 GNAT family N-acetyltransferase [Streptomyces olivaceus]MBZ6112227.1 GNAT family N-acetyltransferase [Streptomyces olivaceus]MBZ6119084.1 GNAT family N-acetyltransferase [Streptomyces olivaceus]MBZ6125752.1 GNAT family N-acetyltransferase [Streptomyces olivaceus]